MEMEMGMGKRDGLCVGWRWGWTREWCDRSVGGDGDASGDGVGDGDGILNVIGLGELSHSFAHVH